MGKIAGYKDTLLSLLAIERQKTLTTESERDFVTRFLESVGVHVSVLNSYDSRKYYTLKSVQEVITRGLAPPIDPGTGVFMKLVTWLDCGQELTDPDYHIRLRHASVAWMADMLESYQGTSTDRQMLSYGREDILSQVRFDYFKILCLGGDDGDDDDNAVTTTTTATTTNWIPEYYWTDLGVDFVSVFLRRDMVTEESMFDFLQKKGMGQNVIVPRHYKGDRTPLRSSIFHHTTTVSEEAFGKLQIIHYFIGRAYENHLRKTVPHLLSRHSGSNMLIHHHHPSSSSSSSSSHMDFLGPVADYARSSTGGDGGHGHSDSKFTVDIHESDDAFIVSQRVSTHPQTHSNPLSDATDDADYQKLINAELSDADCDYHYDLMSQASSAHNGNGNNNPEQEPYDDGDLSNLFVKKATLSGSSVSPKVWTLPPSSPPPRFINMSDLIDNYGEQPSKTTVDTILATFSVTADNHPPWIRVGNQSTIAWLESDEEEKEKEKEEIHHFKVSTEGVSATMDTFFSLENGELNETTTSTSQDVAVVSKTATIIIKEPLYRALQSSPTSLFSQPKNLTVGTWNTRQMKIVSEVTLIPQLAQFISEHDIFCLQELPSRVGVRNLNVILTQPSLCDMGSFSSTTTKATSQGNAILYNNKKWQRMNDNSSLSTENLQPFSHPPAILHLRHKVTDIHIIVASVHVQPKKLLNERREEINALYRLVVEFAGVCKLPYHTLESSSSRPRKSKKGKGAAIKIPLMIIAGDFNCYPDFANIDSHLGGEGDEEDGDGDGNEDLVAATTAANMHITVDSDGEEHLGPKVESEIPALEAQNRRVTRSKTAKVAPFLPDPLSKLFYATTDPYFVTSVPNKPEFNRGKAYDTILLNHDFMGNLAYHNAELNQLSPDSASTAETKTVGSKPCCVSDHHPLTVKIMPFRPLFE